MVGAAAPARVAKRLAVDHRALRDQGGGRVPPPVAAAILPRAAGAPLLLISLTLLLAVFRASD